MTFQTSQFFGAKLAKTTPAVDPWALAAGALFLISVGFAVWPAAPAKAATFAHLLLIAGLAGVAVIGLFAFGRSPPGSDDSDALLADLVSAFSEPAAIVRSGGRVVQANTAWLQAEGGRIRPFGGATASSLFIAMGEARESTLGRALVRLHEFEFETFVSRVGPKLFLVRGAFEANVDVGLLLEDRRVRLALPAPARDAATPSESLENFAAKAPFGVAAFTAEGALAEATLLEANNAFVQLAGAETGATLGALFDAAHPFSEDGPAEVRALKDHERPLQAYINVHDGRRLVYLIDVSAQKQLELRLNQAEKMQAIGQLAGGVAHDFNNLLTAIQLRLDELLLRHPAGDPSFEGLNEIRQTGVRAADLVRKLLAFSRKQTVKRERLDLGELISEFEVLLRRLMREDVRLETEYGRDLPFVLADKSQLETAVMNLAVNARDAMRAQGGGVVRIKTGRLTYDQAKALGWLTAPNRDCALIEVSDTGPGIPPELLDKIFEPFFTTKPVGEGTGMGLATVYGIVEQAEGRLSVESHPGKGATFRILLPVFEGAAPKVAAPVQPAAKPAPRDMSGSGRILFVEDEDMVRNVAARLLRARGYEVIEAADGEEALELAEIHAGKIDMLISDVIMPGLDGPSLLKKARQFLGDAPVMFISGYAEAEFSDLLEGEVGVTFLPKPIDIKTLAERVKAQLRAA